MDQESKEKIINRICAGYLSFIYDKAGFFIGSPTLEIKCRADDWYEEFYEDSLNNGFYSEDDFEFYLLDNELWTDSNESKLKSLIKDIENIKVGIYESIFKSNQKIKLKKALVVANTELMQLYNQKHLYDHLSAKGHAKNLKLKYLVAMSIYNNKWEPIFTNDITYLDSNNKIIDRAMFVYGENRIGEETYRLIASTDPWRNIWNCGKDNDLFGKPLIHWTDEQKSLCLWSRIYDNVYENNDCPPEDVINDNDALDGWMILQRRKRQAMSNRNEAEKRIGDKVKNANEIFIVADTAEDARKIEDLNDATGRAIKRQRFNYIKQKDRDVKEAELPDQQLKLRMAINQKQMERAKNGG